jgi:hypothetical protein
MILKASDRFSGSQPADETMKELVENRDMRLIFEGTKTLTK